MRIDGSHVVVTGGSHGIGVDLAREFARRGARVTVVGRDAERLEQVANEVAGNALQLDLADPVAIENAVAALEGSFGGIDILLNNAGLAMVRGAAEHEPGDARDILAVNVVAPMELVRQVLPGMHHRGRGHIVNVSSLAGVSAVPDLAVYGASKAALHHYTAVVQRELAHRKSPVGLSLVTLGEVAGTHMMEQARQSPTIAAVSARLARARAMPDLTPSMVARKIADAVAQDKPYVNVPARIGPLIGLRNLPSRVQDLVLIGLGK